VHPGSGHILLVVRGSGRIRRLASAQIGLIGLARRDIGLIGLARRDIRRIGLVHGSSEWIGPARTCSGRRRYGSRISASMACAVRHRVRSVTPGPVIRLPVGVNRLVIRHEKVAQRLVSRPHGPT
jgi:hypothetical protein